ncbi:MAG: metallophosphoesterase [Vicinamibacteria bacterium]|nr:metallophosphoesterase [Vicinamibacteria bacterium]
MRRRALIAALILALACVAGCGHPDETTSHRTVIEIDTKGLQPGWLALPSRPDSVKFAVIGDSGRGWAPQHEVAGQMVAYRQQFPFDFVLMAGDNIYEGPATAEDYRVKFEQPYAALLADGVAFYAVLGNHDDPNQRNYAPFNMHGHRYYTFTPPAKLLAGLMTDVRIFALDSTNMDGAQQAWLTEQLSTSNARWKIVLLHHPLYTSGRYGLQARLFRWQLESLLVGNGADVVFSGHEHIYQRSRLQHGIQYFITGGAGSLRRGEGAVTAAIARSYDRDFHFMLVEIAGDALYFQAITRTGVTVDAGVVRQD